MPPEAIIAQAEQHKVDGIAFTFTEPAIFFEYGRDIAHLAHAAGMYTIAKSNGFMLPEVLQAMSTWIDAINIDLKGWRGPQHREIVGGNVGPVLHSLKLASRLGLWLEVSTLLVPGFSDDPQTITNIARFIADELGPHVPWHLLRFFPEYQQTDLPATSQLQLSRAIEIGQSAGLNYIYTQTLSHGHWLQTRCPNCRAVMVERQHNKFLGSHLIEGCCRNCREPLAGRWSPAPLPVFPTGEKDG